MTEYMINNTDQQRILSILLANAPFDGWSERSLKAAIKEVGLEENAGHALFPNGVIDAIALHSELADTAMAEIMESAEWQSKKTTAKIRDAILWRLQEQLPNREAIRKALAVLSMPQHYAAGLKMTQRTIDTLWYGAGDQSTDFNYYTKRLLLTGVYGGTLLAWLDDDSVDMTETAAFLDRRLADVMKIGKLTQECKAKLSHFTLFPVRFRPFA
jgi:ubiquinone biosynthesis protein COQ9